MKKIIFLDIDGVLNSHRWWDKFHEEGLASQEGYDFDLDPEAIMKLNRIMLKVPDVKIVITSTWRFDFKDTVERLQAQGLVIPVIDRTSVSLHESRMLPRGVLVDKWISENARDTCNYVIFDDDRDFLLDQQWNFIQTDTAIGLTDGAVETAIAILGTDDYKMSKAVKSLQKPKQDKQKEIEDTILN